MIVLKFGGSILRDHTSLPKIKEIIEKEWDKTPVVVVSAFYGITNKLIDCANGILKNIDTAETIINFHKAIIKESGLHIGIMDTLFEEFTKAIDSIKIYKQINPKILDYVMAFGERFSSKIIAEYLKSNGLKAKSFEGHQIGLITDSNFGKANPLDSSYRSIPDFFRGITSIPIVAGFIGKDLEGNFTTIGRNGSDFTAAIISASCKALYLKIYSDVDGILSGNPKFIKYSQPIEELSLAEYQELNHWLTRIHPEMVSSVIENNIPLFLLNINNENFKGTKISYKTNVFKPKVMVFRDDIFLTCLEIPYNRIYTDVSKSIIDFFQSRNYFPLLFDIKSYQIYIGMIGAGVLEDFINVFSKEYIIKTYIDKIAVKIIGADINRNTQLLTKVLKISDKYDISINIFSNMAQTHSFIFIFEKKGDYLDFLNELHDNIILK